MNRNIISTLESWSHATDRKPLLLRGARQVGKTWVIRNLGTRRWGTVFEVNFEDNPGLKDVFTTDLDPSRIVRQLEIHFGARIIPGQCLLFFDEIQLCPDAIQSLRYFYEKMPELHVAAAGSLLEFALEHTGIPVGRIHTETLHPLSFDEFLSATGNEMLVAERPSLSDGLEPRPVTQTAHRKLERSLGLYCCVGGMPAVVKCFVQTNSLVETAQIQRQLVRDFIADIPKYGRGQKQIENAAAVWRRVPRFVGQEVTYTTLGEGDQGARTAASVSLLEKAMLVKKVVAASAAHLPLSGFARDKHFKLIHLDVGLMTALAGVDPAQLIDESRADRLMDVFEGRIAEQFVGQSLLADSPWACEGGDLYCWIRPKAAAKAEVDYLLARHGTVIPVEVKKGAAGRLRSLQVLMGETPDVRRALVLRSIDRVEQAGNLVFAPLYTRLD